MSERNVELIEQNVKNNTDDIRDLKKWRFNVDRDINDLKSNQQVTQNNLATMHKTLDELNQNYKTLDEKIDNDREERRKEEIKQLESYKQTVTANMWRIGGSLIATIVAGMVTTILFI